MPRAGYALLLAVTLLGGALVLFLRSGSTPELPALERASVLRGEDGAIELDSFEDLEQVGRPGRAPAAPEPVDPGLVDRGVVSVRDADAARRPIRVLVVDGDDRPLAGAAVVARLDESAGFEESALAADEPSAEVASAETDEDGSAALLVPDDRVYVVTASLAERPPAQATAVAPGAVVQLVLDRGAAVEGFVTLVGDGDPIPGARVRIHHGPDGDEIALMTTDARGYYAASGLATGEGGVLVVPREHAMARWREVTLTEGETARADVEVEEGWTLAGRITDAETGDPLAGAEVSPWDFIGKIERTDEQGRYRLAGVRTRPGVLCARAPGHGRGEVAYAAERDDLDLVLRGGLQVSGRVVGPDGAPLADAQVTVVGLTHEPTLVRREWARARSGRTGEFSIASVRADLPLALGVRLPGFGARAVALERAEPGGAVDVGDVALTPQVILEGVVLDSGGRPTANVGVFLEGPAGLELPDGTGFHLGRRSSFTSAEGRFLFTGLVAGRWDLRAHIGGGRTIDERLELSLDVPHRVVELRMPGGVSVRGRVTDPAGSPLPGAFVMLVPEDGRGVAILAGQCDAAGEFEIEDVPDVTFTARVSKSTEAGDDAPPWAPLAVPGLRADGTPLEFELVPLDGWIEGVVVDADERPVPHALVARGELGPGLGGDDAVLTDGAGRFRIRAARGRPTTVFAWRTEPLDGGQVTAMEWRLGRRPIGETPGARVEGVRAGDPDLRLALGVE